MRSRVARGAAQQPDQKLRFTFFFKCEHSRYGFFDVAADDDRAMAGKERAGGLTDRGCESFAALMGCEEATERMHAYCKRKRSAQW